MQWGEKYRNLHEAAWRETFRVLRKKGRLLLNISDHIRGGERQYVASWHTRVLLEAGFVLADAARVKTPRLRYGANRATRTPSEMVLAFDVR